MYFDEKGAGNTEQCVVLALKTAAEGTGQNKNHGRGPART